MVQWVEKVSLKKICRLLEVSEQERHYEVLLTLKNLADVRRSPSPYSLPIIPREVPLEIVDGEHFVTSNLVSLLAGHAPSTRDLEAEASHREQASWASSIPSTSTKDSNSASPGPGRDERGIHPVKSTPGAQVEDFIPWVCPEPSWPSALEEKEEEEEEEEMTGLLDRYASKKRKRQEDAEREADRAEGSNWLPTDGGSEMHAIVIPGSLEKGSNDQPDPEDIAHGEPRESTLIPPALRVVRPPDQMESRLGNAKLALPGRKRLLPPDQILLNSYLPPCGPASAMEEVTAPGPDYIKLILHLWRPFNRGKSLADHLDNLYPRTLRMPVTIREAGLGEEYSVAVPVGTIKEDIQQIVQDWMQIRNCNFIQSAELVK